MKFPKSILKSGEKHFCYCFHCCKNNWMWQGQAGITVNLHSHWLPVYDLQISRPWAVLFICLFLIWFDPKWMNEPIKLHGSQDRKDQKLFLQPQPPADLQIKCGFKALPLCLHILNFNFKFRPCFRSSMVRVKINSWISDLVTAKNLWPVKKKKKKSYLASSYLVS